VVANQASNSVSVLLNFGDGTFLASSFFSTGIQPRSLQLGDLDDDGDLDATTANGDGSASVLLNNGDGTYATQTTYTTGGGSVGIDLGDLDGDGDLDMAVSNEFGNSISVLLNECVMVEACPADLTGEGDLNFLDVSAFLSAFGMNDPIADFEPDGSFNFLDVSAFLAAFSAGCP
jgi:hypothetical protein